MDFDTKFKLRLLIIICILTIIISIPMIYGVMKRNNEVCNTIAMDSTCKYKSSEKKCYCQSHNFTLTKQDSIDYNEGNLNVEGSLNPSVREMIENQNI